MTTIRLTQDRAVVRIELDRPDQRNAMSSDLVATLISTIATLTHDDSVGAIILTGAGKGFCAGSDLGGLAQMDDAGRQMFEAESGRVARMIGQCPKPVIAAVHGFAIGGGLTLATACDIVIATPDSRWSLPEVPIGLFPAWGMASVFARVGLAKARRLAWGIDMLTGAEAQAWGLVDDLSADPVASAMSLAEQLAALPAQQRNAVKSYFAAHCADEAADLRANEHFLLATRTSEAQASFVKFGSKG
jgi:enoyl-CoA hydratase/carnithine racemase